MRPMSEHAATDPKPIFGLLISDLAAHGLLRVSWPESTFFSAARKTSADPATVQRRASRPPPHVSYARHGEAQAQAVRQITEQHQVLLILDEVVSYRLAPGGYQELVEVTPNHLRFRKRILDVNDRRKAAKRTRDVALDQS